ncbi:MAG: transposase, partial [Planctomycetes bacterium]|nr:transposase [Planctomycetota bacterium]
MSSPCPFRSRRAWVLSLPIEIRYRPGYDGPLLSALLRTFMQHLETYYGDQARQLGYRHFRCGGVTFVQRFGSELHVNPHLHILITA